MMMFLSSSSHLTSTLLFVPSQGTLYSVKDLPGSHSKTLPSGRMHLQNSFLPSGEVGFPLTVQSGGVSLGGALCQAPTLMPDPGSVTTRLPSGDTVAVPTCLYSPSSWSKLISGIWVPGAAPSTFGRSSGAGGSKITPPGCTAMVCFENSPFGRGIGVRLTGMSMSDRTLSSSARSFGHVILVPFGMWMRVGAVPGS